MILLPLQAGGTLLLFVLVFASVDSAACPNGWTLHTNSCYIFKKEAYTWFDANAECRILDAYLAEDDNSEEHAFLVQMAATYDEDVWLGFQDFAVEGVFVGTHSKEPVKDTFWKSREPDDRHGQEDCVLLDHDHGGWYDANCEHSQRPFICEMQSSEDSVVG